MPGSGEGLKGGRLDLLAQVSGAVSQVRLEQADTGLTRLLELLVTELGAGSGSLYRIDLAKQEVEKLARWGEFEAPDWSYSLATAPELAGRLLAGEPILLEVAGLEAPVRALFEPLGIAAGLVVPMMVRGQPWGVIAFWWGKELEFPRELPPALSSVATLVGSLLARLEAEQARERAETWYRLHAEASSEVMVLHREGFILDVNEACLRFMGIEREQVVGRPAVDFIHADDRARVLKRIASGDVEPTEIRFLRADGSYRWGSVAARNATLDGQPVRLIVGRDITEQRRAREIEARARQTQRLESIGVLAGGVAHDFNNLLVGILGNAEAALADLEVGPRRQAVEHIREAALRARGLTGQLLAYAGQSQGELSEVDLNDRIELLLPLLDAIRTGAVRVETRLCSGLPGVMADGAQLDQVVMNLAGNAAEALGGEGTVVIRTEVVTIDEGGGAATLSDRLEPGEYVVVEVRDDGSGMDAEARQRAFDPFFSTKREGRGLGLAVVHGVVRGLGGAIGLETAPGRGTRIRVYLPGLGRPARSAEEPRESEAPMTTGRILIVDDEPMVRLAARRLLELSGFEVQEANGGAAALELMERESGVIDAVLLDWSMPGLSGGQVLVQLRELIPELPIVVSSGAPLDTPLPDVGTVTWLAKPYTLDALVGALATVQAARAGQGSPP
ncbi:MAG: ATP-binding protein [Deltaproteobacteria bacterium]|nr:ATP-binding protein [Deltaproteobacteria bacterium]